MHKPHLYSTELIVHNACVALCGFCFLFGLFAFSVVASCPCFVSWFLAIEEAKKQRVNVLSAEHASMIRTISFGDETYHTLDNYDTEFQDDGSMRNDQDEME